MSNEPKPKTKVDEVLESTATTLDTKSPMGIHPDNLNPSVADLVGADAANPDPLGLSVFKSGRAGLKSAYESVAAMNAAFDAIAVVQTTARGNPVVGKDGIVKNIPPERAAEFADGLGRAFARAATSIDEMEQTIAKAEADLSGRIEKALRDPNRDKPSVLANTTAIRDYIKNLPQAERFSFVSRTLNDETDPVTAHEFCEAIMGANHYTVGLSKKETVMLKELASEVFALRETRQLAAIGKMRDAVALATKSVFDAYARLEPRIPKASPQSVAMRRLKEGV